MHVELVPFETPADVTEFVATLPKEVQAPFMAVYAAGILHATAGLIVAVDVEEMTAHIGDQTNVH